jgi:hypothetical protein
MVDNGRGSPGEQQTADHQWTGSDGCQSGHCTLTHTYTTNYTLRTATRIFQLLVGGFSILLCVFASIRHVLETLFVPVLNIKISCIEDSECVNILFDYCKYA